jgi:peptidoglycan/LPS O-acetylase OafA/YrhL
MGCAGTKQYASLAPTRIDELESVRGLAALLVVFHHLPKWNAILDVGILNNGYEMVDLFFVLSGFVIFTAYSDRIRSGRDLLRFQFLRLGRLYPVHILFLGVFVLIEFAKYLAQTRLGISSPSSEPFKQNSLTALFQQIFLIQAIGPTGHDMTFNAPAWSISVEFFVYLIFGVSLIVFRKARDVSFFVLAVASISLLSTGRTLGFDDLLRCVAGFSIGCLTASVTRKLPAKVPGFVSLIVLVTIAIFLQVKPVGQYNLAIDFLASALIASLVLSTGGLLKKTLRLEIFTWLGSISYAMYMSQWAVLWTANQIFRVVLKKPEMAIYGQNIPQASEAETLVAWVLVTAIVLVISVIIHRFVEVPFRSKSRRIVFENFKGAVALRESVS